MRKENWPELLNDYIAQNISTPFEWGKFDCCLFAAGAVEAETGIDFAEEFRGKYSTEFGSVKALKKIGKGDIKQTLESKFGPLKAPLLAKRGDIALVETEDGDALGIIWGGAVWVSTKQGLAKLPMRELKGCWEVPCHQ